MTSRVNEIIQKYQQVKPSYSELNSPSILSLSQTDISGITEVVEQPFDQQQAYALLKTLKEEVLNTLVTYQKQLQIETNDFKQLKAQLVKDAAKVNQDYGELVNKMKQNFIVPGQETQLVMNVIEEFVAKFGQVEAVNRYAQKQATIEVKPPPSRIKQPKQNLEDDLSNFLQITNISNINFTMQDDTFYKAKSNAQIEQRLQGKLERLKIRLEKALNKEQLVNTRKILKEAIEDLNQILVKNDVKDIKRVVYKLEHTIKKLGENSNGQDTVNLYKLLQKAIKFSKKKECLSVICEKPESKISQTTVISKKENQSQVSEVKSITSTSQKPLNDKVNYAQFQNSDQNRMTSYQFTKKQNLEINAKIQQPQPSLQLKTTVHDATKPILQENIMKQNTVNKNLTPNTKSDQQSQFLHLCLKVKGTLPMDHPGRKILIFQLYDRAVIDKIPQSEWHAWVETQLKQG